MANFKKSSPWFALICVFFGTFVGALVIYTHTIKNYNFLTISSPARNYTVALRGQKGNPLIFIINEVRFDALKNGKVFVPDQYLHSGDNMDISFEIGYPNHQWLEENVLRFYNESLSKRIKPEDKLIIINRTNKVIKYMKAFSEDKLLLFDVNPASEVTVPISPPGGDFKWMYIEGEYYDGLSFSNNVNLTLPKGVNTPFTYYLYITDTDVSLQLSSIHQLP
jgi:hypothetical protein